MFDAWRVVFENQLPSRGCEKVSRESRMWLLQRVCTAKSVGMHLHERCKGTEHVMAERRSTRDASAEAKAPCEGGHGGGRR